MKTQYNLPEIRISKFSKRVTADLSGKVDGVDLAEKSLNGRSIVNIQKINLNDVQFK